MVVLSVFLFMRWVQVRMFLLGLVFSGSIEFSCDSVLTCSHSILRLLQCGIGPFQNELFIHLDLMSAVRQVVYGTRSVRKMEISRTRHSMKVTVWCQPSASVFTGYGLTARGQNAWAYLLLNKIMKFLPYRPVLEQAINARDLVFAIELKARMCLITASAVPRNENHVKKEALRNQLHSINN